MLANKHKAVRLLVRMISTEPFYDNLYVHDGDSARSRLIATFTGEPSRGQVVYASQSRMHIVVRSDSDVTGAGYRLEYEGVSPLKWDFATKEAEDRRVNYTGTVLYSPLYPRNYPNGLDRRWWLKLTPPESYANHLIKLTIVSLQLESHFDYLILKDGDSLAETPIAVLTSRRDLGTAFYSRGTQLLAYLHTDTSTSESGFSVLYQAVLDSEACRDGKTMYAEKAARFMDVFNDFGGFHGRNMHCVWYFKAPAGHTIVLTVKNGDKGLAPTDTLAFYDDVRSSFELDRITRATLAKRPLIATTGRYGSVVFVRNGKKDKTQKAPAFVVYYKAVKIGDTLSFFRRDFTTGEVTASTRFRKFTVETTTLVRIRTSSATTEESTDDGGGGGEATTAYAAGDLKTEEPVVDNWSWNGLPEWAKILSVVALVLAITVVTHCIKTARERAILKDEQLQAKFGPVPQIVISPAEGS